MKLKKNEIHELTNKLLRRRFRRVLPIEFSAMVGQAVALQLQVQAGYEARQRAMHRHGLPGHVVGYDGRALVAQLAQLVARARAHVGVAAQRHAVGGGGQRALGAAPLQRQRDAVRQLHVQVERRLPLRLVLHVLPHLRTDTCIVGHVVKNNLSFPPLKTQCLKN